MSAVIPKDVAAWVGQDLAHSFRAEPFRRVRGIIARRLLVNFRADPTVVQGILPAPFRPKRIKGWSVVGICLIRLEAIRPWGWPKMFGLASENAAHRTAVEWDEGSLRREGVFIPWRHSNSWLNCRLGGRFFPGIHHRAAFTIRDRGHRLELTVRGRSDSGDTRVVGETTERIRQGSVFASLDEATVFFQNGAVGWSPSRDPGVCEGLELRTDDWNLTPFAVEHVRSSYFQDPRRFPPGTCELDSAFLMRGVRHAWHGRGRMPTGGRRFP